MRICSTPATNKPHSLVYHTLHVRERVAIAEIWETVPSYHSVKFFLSFPLHFRVQNHGRNKDGNGMPCLQQVCVSLR